MREILYFMNHYSLTLSLCVYWIKIVWVHKGSNDQSKLLNNYFISKSFWYQILCFEIFIYLLNYFKKKIKKVDIIFMLNKVIYKSKLKNIEIWYLIILWHKEIIEKHRSTVWVVDIWYLTPKQNYYFTLQSTIISLSLSIYIYI
jgi:hypothetical protein